MGWIDLLFPKTCPCCGGELRNGQTVCDRCTPDIHYNTSPHCPDCGVSLRDCHCHRRVRPYERVVAPFYYEGAIREAILRMKFGQREEVARFLAEALKREIEARYFGETFHVLTVVPMSRDRYVSRGFNQAKSIGEFLMKDPPTPLRQAVPDYGLLKKSSREGGSMQHLLGAAGRKQNIRDSVTVGKNRELEGKHVLLLDDIVTTGATTEECAAILRLHGAEQVSVAAAAVTRYRESFPGKTIQVSPKRVEL